MWVRAFSRGGIWLPRGNGKSELGAAIELLGVAGDGEEAAECYGAAEDRDQASVIYRVAARMVELSPALSKRLRVIDSTKRIIDRSTGSFYRALPRDEAGTGSQGFRPHVTVVDELHTQRRRDLLDALKKGMGKRAQPLLLTITTAGNDPTSPEAEDYAYAKGVLDGTIDDPNYFAYIREAPEDADPFNEKTWFAANPALGDFLSIETLRQEAREARQKPSELNAFLQFRLNRHVSQVTRFVPMDAWDATAGMVVQSQLEGRRAFGGLDVASSTDMAAFILVVPDDEDETGYDVLCRFWLPGTDIADREVRDGRPYRQWAKEGRLRLTTERTTDHAAIRDEILHLTNAFDIAEISYRPYNAGQLVSELEAEGLMLVETQSTAAKMNDATRKMLALVLAERLRHGGNTILRTMADALAVKADHNGDIRPDQQASGGNVSGMLALIRAIDRAMRNDADGGYLFTDKDFAETGA